MGQETVTNDAAGVDKGNGDSDNEQCGPCSDLGKVLAPRGYCSNCEDYLCELCYQLHTKARVYREHKLEQLELVFDWEKDGVSTQSDGLSRAVRSTTQPTSAHRGDIYITIRVSPLMLVSFAVVILALFICMFSSTPWILMNKYNEAENDFDDRVVVDTSRADVNDFDHSNVDSTNAHHIDTDGNQTLFSDQIVEPGHLIVTAENKKSESEDSHFSTSENAPHLGESAHNSKHRTSDQMDLPSAGKDSNDEEFANADIKGYDTVESNRKEKQKSIYNWKALHDIDVNIMIEEDDPFITGIAVVNEKQIVVIDHANSKVKLIDTEIRIVLHEQLYCEMPWSVAKTNVDEVAVTCPSSERIGLFKVTDVLEVIGTIFIDGGKPLGIAFLNNKLFVTFMNPDHLKIIDLPTGTYDTFEPIFNGYPLFSEPNFIKVHPDLHTIFVSDNDNYTLSELNMDGTVNQVLFLADMSSSYVAGIEIGPHGDIWICYEHEQSSQIHAYNIYKYEVRPLFDNSVGLEDPYTLSYCNTSGRVYIGDLTGSVMKVHKLVSLKDD